jgi:hypothetical protein
VVIPIHDINLLSRRPVMTWLLIAVNVLVFVLFTPVSSAVMGLHHGTTGNVCEQRRFFEEWGAIPKELLTNKQLPLADTGKIGLNPDGTTAAWSARRRRSTRTRCCRG